MQEVTVKGNNTGLRVFIDGEPDLRSMPDELEIIATVLEMVISKQHEKYIKRKSQPAQRKKVMSTDNT